MEKGMDTSMFLPDSMKLVFDNILSIVLLFDDNGNITYINEPGKSELGYEANDVNIRDIFPMLLSENTSVSFFTENAAQKITNVTVYRKNHTCFNAELKAVQINEADKGSINMISVINTQYELHAKQEIERVENTMRTTMKARNEFVANVTHELRTPVNGIKGHIKNMQTIETDLTKRRTLDIVLKCCDNMEKIINNFLDFSKIEAGKFEINESSFNFRECINHIVDTSVVIANEKGLKFSAYVADDIPETVIGDELRIIQVLNNLVSNALKFTSIGYVSIEVYKTRLKHGRMELTFFVIDTGIGVTLEEKEKMFKSFSQVDGSITRKYGGTGLGLYVTRQLVELMHGDIHLDSTKGRGSTFSFNIEVGVEGCEPDSETAAVLPQFLRDGRLHLSFPEDIDRVYAYGSAENLKEANSNIEKLLLCIDMENWEKAEFFANNIKRLAFEADKPLKSLVFKLQMAVRREDSEKSCEILNKVKEYFGG